MRRGIGTRARRRQVASNRAENRSIERFELRYLGGTYRWQHFDDILQRLALFGMAALCIATAAVAYSTGRSLISTPSPVPTVSGQQAAHTALATPPPTPLPTAAPAVAPQRAPGIQAAPRLPSASPTGKPIATVAPTPRVPPLAAAATSARLQPSPSASPSQVPAGSGPAPVPSPQALTTGP